MSDVARANKQGEPSRRGAGQRSGSQWEGDASSAGVVPAWQGALGDPGPLMPRPATPPHSGTDAPEAGDAPRDPPPSDSGSGSAPQAAPPPSVREVLSSPGDPLDARTRESMESKLGHDLGAVRVHTDARASESAKLLDAPAYTFGRDVVFGLGQYRPGTREGDRLLSHELTHAAQSSKGGAGDGADPARASVAPHDHAAESEAERAEASLAAGEPAPRPSPAPLAIYRQRPTRGVNAPARPADAGGGAAAASPPPAEFVRALRARGLRAAEAQNELLRYLRGDAPGAGEGSIDGGRWEGVRDALISMSRPPAAEGGAGGSAASPQTGGSARGSGASAQPTVGRGGPARDAAGAASDERAWAVGVLRFEHLLPGAQRRDLRERFERATEAQRTAAHDLIGSLWERYVSLAHQRALLGWIETQIQQLRRRRPTPANARRLQALQEWALTVQARYETGAGDAPAQRQGAEQPRPATGAQPAAGAQPATDTQQTAGTQPTTETRPASGTQSPAAPHRLRPPHIPFGGVRAALERLTEASEPVGDINGDFLRDETRRIYGQIGAPMRYQLHMDLLTSGWRPRAGAAADALRPEIERLRDAAARAREALESARAAATGPRDPTVRRARARANDAQRRLDAALQQRSAQMNTLTAPLRRARPDLMAEHVFDDESLTGARAAEYRDETLTSLRAERDRQLGQHLAGAGQGGGFDERLAAALGPGGDAEAARHQIYLNAADNLEHGFDGNFHESLVAPLVEAMQRLRRPEQPGTPGSARRGPRLRDLGIESDRSAGFMAREGHGLGAFDIAAPMTEEQPPAVAGQPGQRVPVQVTVRFPETIRMPEVFPPSYAHRDAQFVHRESFIIFVGNPEEAAEINFRLAGVTTLRRVGHHMRGREFEMALMGLMSDFSAEHLTEEFRSHRAAARPQLDAAIRARLQAQGFDIGAGAAGQSVLREIGPRDFFNSMVNPLFTAHLSRRAGAGTPAGPLSPRARTMAVLAAARYALEHMANPEHFQMMSLAMHRDNIPMSGPAGRSVQVAHRYEQQGTGLMRFVVVNYSHLASIPPNLRQNDDAPAGMVIGTVGMTGNAIDPHVHLSLQVREARHGRPHNVLSLTPFDFFPELSRLRTPPVPQP